MIKPDKEKKYFRRAMLGSYYSVLFLWILFPEGVSSGSGGSCPLGWGTDLNGMCDVCPENYYSDSTEPDEPCEPCPVDRYGHTSVTHKRGATSCFFTPYIYDFYPKFGPESGGTNITVQMMHMENRTILQFLVADFGTQAKIVQGSDRSTFYVMSSQADSGHTGPLYAKIEDNYGTNILHYSTSDSKFSYRKDPVILSLNRNGTIISGGINFEVTGQDLNSTAKPMAEIIPFTNKEQETFTSVCTVNSNVLMTCAFPDLRSLANHVDILEDNTTPPPQRRRRRQAHNDGVIATNIQFYVGFQMDGVTNYRLFQQIYVYIDPFIYLFEEENNIRNFNPDETTTLRIDGEAIDYVLTLDDITVEVGDSLCQISSMAIDQIICSPSTSKPDHGENGAGPDNSVTVIVRFGNKSFVVGHLQYPAGGLSMMHILIIIVVGVVVLFIVIVWCSCIHCCKKKRRQRGNAERNKGYSGQHIKPVVAQGFVGPMGAKDNSYLDLQKIGTGTPTKKRISVIQKVTDCLLDQTSVTIGECIGKGQFGKVFKGHFKNKHTRKKLEVAIKTVQAEEDDSALDEFLEEALVMKGFSHKNVVTMYGVTVKDEKPYVVLEYMDLGDLKSYISNPKVMLMTTDLLKFSIQIAEGMTYLSGNRFVHRDLAARNCMVNSNKVVKIADFGLSRDIYTTDYYRAETKNRPLPIRWMALESMQTGVFTVRSDVWSYGVVLWELFTRGAKPYADVSNYQLKGYLQLGKRLDKPRYCPPPLYATMQTCWNESVQIRPYFSDLVKKTKDILAKFNEKNEQVDGANSFSAGEYLTAVR